MHKDISVHKQTKSHFCRFLPFRCSSSWQRDSAVCRGEVPPGDIVSLQEKTNIYTICYYYFHKTIHINGLIAKIRTGLYGCNAFTNGVSQLPVIIC